MIPPKVLSGLQVAVGDASTRTFSAPLAEWVEDSEEIFVNDIRQVRGVDYVCSNDANAPGLPECSILRDMEYIGEYTTAPQAVILPIKGTPPYRNGSFPAALWDSDHRTITYAFPEDGVREIKRLVLKNFIAYIRISSGSSSYNSNWSGGVWSIQYSDDGTVWEDAGDVTIDSSNRAELVLERPVTARYWRFTISSRITGVLFCASGYDSIIGYGDTQPITFTEAPADGAVITMNATVDCPMKNENFIIDVNPTFEV